MKTITVFTPTFNRAFCLPQLYSSLVHQTNKDFIWLVVDDGSSDTTQNLVKSWQQENRIEIQYFYKENGGMHTAHNVAYQNIKTEFNVCIDSDDYMPNNAIELILNTWKSIENKEKIAGLIGLDADKNGKIIGDSIPTSISYSKLNALYDIYKLTGDKKVVIKTEILKKYPLYPEFKNERLVPLGTLYLLIDQDFDWFCVNHVFCIVEYLADGSSNTIFKQYKQSPQGFGYSRLLEMKYSKNFGYTFKKAMHYISSCLFQNKFTFFQNNPQKFATFLAIPFGFLFHFYLILKLKK